MRGVGGSRRDDITRLQCGATASSCAIARPWSWLRRARTRTRTLHLNTLTTIFIFPHGGAKLYSRKYITKRTLWSYVCLFYILFYCKINNGGIRLCHIYLVWISICYLYVKCFKINKNNVSYLLLKTYCILKCKLQILR